MFEAHKAGLKAPKSMRNIYDQVYAKLHPHTYGNLKPYKIHDFVWSWCVCNPGIIYNGYHYDIVRAYETAAVKLPKWNIFMGQPKEFHDDGIYWITSAKYDGPAIPEPITGVHSGLWINKLKLYDVVVHGCDLPVGYVDLSDVHKFITENFSNSKKILVQAWTHFMPIEAIEQKTYDLGMKVSSSTNFHTDTPNPQWGVIIVERVKMKLYEAMKSVKNRGGQIWRMWVDDIICDRPLQAQGTPGEFKLKKGGFTGRVDHNGLTVIGDDNDFRENTTGSFNGSGD